MRTSAVADAKTARLAQALRDCWLGLSRLAKFGLESREHRDLQAATRELTRGITKWAKSSNENPKPFIWTKSAEEIFASMQKYLEPIVMSGTSDKGH